MSYTNPGRIIYQGPSMSERSRDIFVALSPNSSNTKTGPMIQSWIMPDDMGIWDARRDGLDGSVCSGCTLRPSIARERRKLDPTAVECYVMTRTLAAVERARKARSYRILDPDKASNWLRSRPVRLGSFGNPSAVPIKVWDGMTKNRRWTGYDHDWRQSDPAYARYCMASVENANQRDEAKAKGYRTYRTRSKGTPLLAGEIDCPHESKQVTCHDCGLCDGTQRGRHSSAVVDISIEASTRIRSK